MTLGQSSEIVDREEEEPKAINHTPTEQDTIPKITTRHSEDWGEVRDFYSPVSTDRYYIFLFQQHKSPAALLKHKQRGRSRSTSTSGSGFPTPYSYNLDDGGDGDVMMGSRSQPCSHHPSFSSPTGSRCVFDGLHFQNPKVDGGSRLGSGENEN